eukprot:CAMPEP_0113609668 /NCGR_PEP_ID=MMETSP0017_2-20120614/4618_1 /TAXON_ID=2856 /ORGANISM="Cylindrotheca closterium" /LENGTH=426 /DNA_ID=CAMNT_0000518509 /DNA_START=19 /DNA_END=1299 /DNA_ORIENTATION=- /assembly_acc=CAM_ASM_000147
MNESKTAEKKFETLDETGIIKKEDDNPMPDKVSQPPAAVVEPTQDSTDNDHGMEAEKLNDETVKADDEEKLSASDPKIESESKLLKDLDDEAPKTFPQILMEILNNEEESDTIAWLPHGRSFIIYKKKRFAAHTLPKFFKATKFTSFTRKLNRWGFTRVTRGPEMGSYYHKLFLRDESNLCLRMSSHSSSKFQEQQQLMPNPMGMPFGGMPFGMMMNPMNMNPAEINQQNQLIQAQLQQLQWQQYQLQQIQQQQASAGMQDGSEGHGGPQGHHPNAPHHGHPPPGSHSQHPQGHPSGHPQPPHMMHGPPPHNMGPPHAPPGVIMGPPPGAPLGPPGPHPHAPGAPQPPHHQVPPPHGQVIPPSQHHQGPPRPTTTTLRHNQGPTPPPQPQSAPPQQQGGQPMMVHHGQGMDDRSGMDRAKDGTAEV